MSEIEKKVLDALFEGKLENYQAAIKKGGADTTNWQSITNAINRDDVIQRTLKETFKDDKEAYNAHIAESKKTRLNWRDVLVHAETLPEYKTEALEVIKTLLGYVPFLEATIQHEPFIRALVQQHDAGQINDDQYFDGCEDCVKHIRNFEIGHHNCMIYQPEIYERYDNYLPEYKTEVKNRLAKFLGYTPLPEHSAAVEVILREELASDLSWLAEKPTIVDYQAINIIKYREALLPHGRKAADASPLFAQEINFRNK